MSDVWMAAIFSASCTVVFSRFLPWMGYEIYRSRGENIKLYCQSNPLRGGERYNLAEHGVENITLRITNNDKSKIALHSFCVGNGRRLEDQIHSAILEPEMIQEGLIFYHPKNGCVESGDIMVFKIDGANEDVAKAIKKSNLFVSFVTSYGAEIKCRIGKVNNGIKIIETKTKCMNYKKYASWIVNSTEEVNTPKRRAGEHRLPAGGKNPVTQL